MTWAAARGAAGYRIDRATRYGGTVENRAYVEAPSTSWSDTSMTGDPACRPRRTAATSALNTSSNSGRHCSRMDVHETMRAIILLVFITGAVAAGADDWSAGVSWITDDAGRVVGKHSYHPFGPELPTDKSEPSATRLKYTGHERDGELDYMHARYYDSHMGRFLSVDPSMDLKANLPNPQRWNRYSYVSNNPINKTDPDGRDEYNMMQRQLGIQDDWHGRDKYQAAGLAAAAVVVAAVAVAPEVMAAAPYVMPLAIRAQPVLNALRNLGAAETGQATPIGRNSVIQGYSVSNHAWRKSGLGRGATEEMVSGVISGAKAAGTVTEAASTHSKHAGNTITTYVHNGVKVVVDDTRRVIMSIRPVDSKKFKVEALPDKQQ